MKHLILGTAGHIDHGKTSLVKALTGIDTDRLKEEKARGITIELGFAHLELPGETDLGIVDVPGHEKFVRAMVSGVTGMDMVMLVIAADEGIMPQTREHLDILRLLGVRQGLVALTKSDLVSDEWLELAIEEIREFVAGTFLEGAPVVPVSSRSGAGIELLKEELEKLAASAMEKKSEGYFRLPVDRVFTVAGFGTVVTGTLLSGEIAVGDELELLPSGREAKVRTVQAHGKKVDQGEAGQRLAVNLQGIDLDQVGRGDLLVPRGVFKPTRVVDVRLDYLSSAPRNLKHRSMVRLHSATYDVEARVVLLDRELLKPGESVYVQLRLEEPVLLLSGDSYLIRSSSPAITIGGGIVLDPFPPARRRRSEEALQLLSSLDYQEHQRIIELIVGQSLLTGISFEEIVIRSGIPRKVAESALADLLADRAVLQMTRDPRTFLSANAYTILKQGLLDEVLEAGKNNPAKNSIGKEELKTRLPKRSDARFFTPLLSALEKDDAVVIERDLVRPAGKFVVANAAATNPVSGLIISILTRGVLEPPTLKELAKECGCDEKVLKDSLASLVRSGQIARISPDLYYSADVVAGVREKLVAHLTQHQEIIPSVFRELTGLSRKFLIPLLEYFDSEKVTIRVGDKRVLRRKTG